MNIKILVGAVIIIIMLIILGIRNFSTPNKLVPQPIIIFSPSPSAPSGTAAPSIPLPSLETTVGKTTDQEVNSLSLLASKTTLLDGKTEYKFESTPQLINHVVITQNNLVVFEKGKEVKERLQLPKASAYFTLYGQPEVELTGSKLYGNFEKTYVYASRGFAILVNPFTDEVDELQVFLPMTASEYRNIWGQDIEENQSGGEQFQ